MARLEGILTEELRVYGELARACSEVTEKVKSCDLDGLAEVTVEQNELLMAAANVEKGRIALLSELLGSGDGSVPVGNADADSSLDFLAEPYASRLADHAVSLRTVVDELRMLSRRNRALLDYSSRVVGRAVRFICGAPESDGTYERPGSCTGRPHPNQTVLSTQA
jgi:hypothetical protein